MREHINQFYSKLNYDKFQPRNDERANPGPTLASSVVA